jgi:hypothetical protein
MNDGITADINKMSGGELYDYIARLNKFPGSACTKAIKREFFVRNKLFFEIGKLAEDLEWTTRLFLHASHIIYCEAPYYNYRQSKSGSRSTTADEKTMMHILDTVKANCALAEIEVNESKKRMIYSFTEYMYRWLILGYGKVSSKHKAVYRSELKRYDYVLGVRKDKSSQLIRITYRLFGVAVSSLLLNFYLYRIRERGR